MEALETSVIDVDWVMEQLDAQSAKLPEEALRAAQAHPQAVIPRLIQAIENATEAHLAGESVEGNAPFFGLFLLTEFRAQHGQPFCETFHSPMTARMTCSVTRSPAT